MAAVVGSLLLELIADNAALARDLQVAGRNVTKFENQSRQSLGRMDKSFSTRFASMGRSAMQMAATVGRVGGVIGAGLAVGIATTRKASQAILEVGDAARQAGVDVEAFSTLRYVAEQNRIGVDSLTDGLKELNLRADEFIVTGGGSAAEAFARLGYDAETLAEKLKDPEELFVEIIGRLGELDKAAQIRIADEIFGGTGGEKFVQLIGQGEEGIRRTMQAGRDLGVVINDDLVVKAGELEGAFNNVTTAISSGLHQAIVNASWALFDFLQQFSAVENRTTASLENSMRELGARRVELEAAILAQESALSNYKSEFGDDFAGIGGPQAALESNLEGLRADFEAIAAEERAILDVLESRTPIEPPSTSTAPTVTTPGGSSGGSASATREETDAVTNHILALREELALIGQTEARKRVVNELRAAGVTLASDEGQAIAQLVQQIQMENDAHQALQESIATASSMTKDFVGGLISDLRSGVSATEALGNAFGRLGDRLLDMALNAAIDGFLSSIFGGGSMGSNSQILQIEGFPE